ncbi:MAG: DUF4145 domain-containing protein [Chloroflexi bacterium]|nr:DUF4145 domain-containing protein [Chloroflexota bacterium]
MSTPELVLEYVKTLAWPVVVSFVLILFHSQLSDLIQRVTRIKLPGGGELDAEIKNVTEKVGEQAPVSSPSYTQQEFGASILERVEHDPTLALAELRMQLEQVLRAMHSVGVDSSSPKRPTSLTTLIRDLQHSGDMPAKLAEPLRDVIAIANRAVHGERVSQDAAEELVNVGVRLLEELRTIYGGMVSNPVDSFVISDSARDDFMNKTRYTVTTIVPVVKEPYMNIRILDQDGLDELLDGYGEYAEFLVAIEPIDTTLPRKDTKE